MTITNGYTDLATFKQYVRITSTGTSATQVQQLLEDDSIASMLIESVSRDIDNLTGRQFFVSTGTYLFDQTWSREIYFDRDVLSVVSVTNGDGSNVASTEYNLYPLNKSPKRAIRLKEASNISWQDDSNGNSEGVISMVLVIGYASSIPTEIKDACLIMAKSEYNKRLGENDSGNTIITPNGTFIASDSIPKTALAKLQKFMRNVIGG